MRSTSRVGAWVVLVTLMLSSALQGLGSVLSFGVVVLLAGTLDGFTLGLASGLVHVGVAAVAAVLLLWVVLRVSPPEPTVTITAVAVVVGLVGWGFGYAANAALGARVTMGATADIASYYGVLSAMYMLATGIEHTSWIAAVIVAHVKGIEADPR